MGWGGLGQNFLADTQSRLYPHMRAKFGRDPTSVSKKVSFKFIIGFSLSLLDFIHNEMSVRQSLTLDIDLCVSDCDSIIN